jgi:hypothetical protein
MELAFDAASILAVHLKPAPTGRLQAAVDFIAQMTKEAAETLHCLRHVYDEEDNPVTDFKGLTLKLQAEAVDVMLHPEAGKAITLKCSVLKSFSVAPDSGGDAQLHFSGVVPSGIRSLVAFFDEHGEALVSLTLASEQEELFPVEEALPEDVEEEEEESDEEPEEEEPEPEPVKAPVRKGRK